MVIAVLLITRTIAVWVAHACWRGGRAGSASFDGSRRIRRATRRIAVGIIWIFGIASAYPLLPWAKSAIFQGMSVVLGLALSLASTGLVNQWISGLMLLYSRSFRTGTSSWSAQWKG